MLTGMMEGSVGATRCSPKDRREGWQRCDVELCLFGDSTFWRCILMSMVKKGGRKGVESLQVVMRSSSKFQDGAHELVRHCTVTSAEN
jgi:hypothetical protein